MQNIIMFDVVSHSFKILLFYNKIVELNMVNDSSSVIFFVTIS